LQRHLGAFAGVGADRGSDHGARCGTDRRTSAAADGRAETRAESRAKQPFADGLVVRSFCAAGNALAGILLADRFVLLERFQRLVVSRHHADCRSHGRRHAGAHKSRRRRYRENRSNSCHLIIARC